ncbi:hypothetical protein HID58_086946, partial [Brassica napus]
MKKHNYINDRNVDDDDEEMNQPFEQELSENSYIIILQKELKDLIQQNEKLKVKRYTLSAQQILQMNFINETKYDFGCPIKLPKIRDGNPKRNHATISEENGVEGLLNFFRNGDHSENIQKLVIGAISNLAVMDKIFFSCVMSFRKFRYCHILQKELEDLTQQNEKLEVERHTLRAQQILQMGLINEIYLLCIQNMTIKLPQIGDGNFEVIFFS